MNCSVRRLFYSLTGSILACRCRSRWAIWWQLATHSAESRGLCAYNPVSIREVWRAYWGTLVHEESSDGFVARRASKRSEYVVPPLYA